MSTISSQEQSPKPKKPWWKKWWSWLIIVGVLFLGLLALNEWSKGQIDNHHHEMATEACKEAVTEKAKYPGAVEFPKPVEVSSRQGINDKVRTFTASGEVDFANGFGVPNRGTYTCTVLIEDDAVTLASSQVAGMKSR